MHEQEINLKWENKKETFLRLLYKIYEPKDNQLMLKILSNSIARLEVWSTYNNFDNDPCGLILYLTIPESLYLEILSQKEIFQNEIAIELNKISDIRDEYIEEVNFSIENNKVDDSWKKKTNFLINKTSNISDREIDEIWGKDTYRVFLSHKVEKKQETANLKTALSKFGISCFVAHQDIAPTKEWQKQIEIALHSMNAFVALLSPDFHNSNWTDQEVGFAYAKRVPIISVKLGRDPYGFIGKEQALSSTWEQAHLGIIKILLEKSEMIDAFIKATYKCDSWNKGNDLSKSLEYITHLTDNQVKNIITAYNTNSEVSSSWGFNGTHEWNYGKGLLYHLKRITNKEFKLSSNGKIAI